MNLQQTLKILGSDFAKCHVGSNKNQAFSNREDGSLSVCFRYSKMYDGNVWWTSELPLTIDACDFIIIAMQGCGLLVLPRNVVMLQYWEDLDVSTLKSGRRNIRVKAENGKLYLYNRTNQPKIDVSEYLHNGDALK